MISSQTRALPRHDGRGSIAPHHISHRNPLDFEEVDSTADGRHLARS
jgi:hypothetical protein